MSARRYWAYFLTLSALWGASYLFIKIGLRDMSAAEIVSSRAALAAPVVLGVGGTGIAFVFYYTLIAARGPASPRSLMAGRRRAVKCSLPSRAPRAGRRRPRCRARA